MFGKRKIAALVAEFLGTGILTLLILNVQRSSIGVPFFISMAAGITFALVCFSVGSYSGGYFNPAVTLALWTAKKLSTITSIVFIIVQFIGAYAAYGLYTYFVNQHVQNIGGHYSGRVLIAEAVGTGIFSFALGSAVYSKLERAYGSLYAGVSLMIGMIAASSASLGLLNPAIALGDRSWVWGTYVLGPVIGAIIGLNLYGIVFADAKLSFSLTTTSSSKSTTSSSSKKSSKKKK